MKTNNERRGSVNHGIYKLKQQKHFTQKFVPNVD